MIEKVINRLNDIIDKVPDILTEIGEDKMSVKPSPNKWSKKEIIGHLIDSATNNHQRFIRGQFETIPEIRYDQNKWIEYSFYQQIDSNQIILFWTIYNKQLIEIIKRIPTEHLQRQIKVGENLLTIEFLIADYVEHLEHHLKQVFNY
ncbi:DinB family protein [Polluticaenibacter yanchengensis]|uniref:DinB family protein n=1 Tax=Polluticaenibacter yanchengensis TaxID=3014562 RepID=A0ABT4UPC4_9BACT|nr:DinB family protein [Chitinophagaceae bacterium LY-5]